MTLTTQAAIAPGGWPVLGHTLALVRRPLEFLVSLPAQGDLVEIRIGSRRMWVVCCPELTQRVLRDGRTYDKGGPIYDQARMLGGDSLLTCAHGPHQRQRRLLQPTFTRDRLAVYATEMSRQLDVALASCWHDGQVIDVLAAMNEITTRVTARALFTTHFSPQQSTDFLHSLTVILEGISLRMIMPAWLRRVPLVVNRRFEQASSTMDTLTYEIINAYRCEGVDHGDLLSMMLAARDEHGDALTDTEIRDQVLTFWGAGTETTAALLAWSLHLLAQHPHVTRRHQTEVDAVLDEAEGHRPRRRDPPGLHHPSAHRDPAPLPTRVDIHPGAYHRGHPGRQDTARRHHPDLQPVSDPPTRRSLPRPPPLRPRPMAA